MFNKGKQKYLKKSTIFITFVSVDQDINKISKYYGNFHMRFCIEHEIKI